MLAIFRRHTVKCEKNYRQGQKVYRPQTARQIAKDCTCPIVVEGKLQKETLINRSTKTNNWDEAESVVAQWESWGTAKQPAEIVQNPTVDYAVQAYLATKQNQGIEPATLNALKVLLVKRLLVFAGTRNLTDISQFSNLDITSKFVESWTSLAGDGETLTESSKRAGLERLRAFFRYCIERKWMSENPASKLKFQVEVAPKFSMEPAEVTRLFAEMDFFADGRGGTGGDNAKELRLFCEVMLMAGLRISDTTALHRRNLVPRVSGTGWAFQILQTKTKKHVYIPIPTDLAEKLLDRPFKDDSGYWFFTGNGCIETAINNWYVRITKVIGAANQKQPFRNPVTPHTFRHTFAINHLNEGTDVKIVSRMLGHSSTAVTEKHYSHAVLSTLVAMEQAYDRSAAQFQAKAAAV
jgi:integrase/recombinase XerC